MSQLSCLAGRGFVEVQIQILFTPKVLGSDITKFIFHAQLRMRFKFNFNTVKTLKQTCLYVLKRESMWKSSTEHITTAKGTACIQ